MFFCRANEVGWFVPSAMLGRYPLPLVMMDYESVIRATATCGVVTVATVVTIVFRSNIGIPNILHCAWRCVNQRQSLSQCLFQGNGWKWRWRWKETLTYLRISDHSRARYICFILLTLSMQKIEMVYTLYRVYL